MMKWKQQWTALVLACMLTMAQILPAAAQPRDWLRAIGGFIAPVSQQQEVYAGAQLDRTMRERYTESTNVALQEYVSSIGKRLAAQSGTNYPFTYTVLADSRTANAFAGPGGFIYITEGLINIMESESQLAAILAHETAHVMHRHVVRQMQERNATDLALVALARVTDRDFNNRLVRLGELVLFQRFSREDEFEADLTGARLMARAGYNPQGMVQMLDKLNALESRGIYISFLRSHPSSEARARLVEEHIARNRLEKPGQVVDSRRFHQVVQ